MKQAKLFYWEKRLDIYIYISFDQNIFKIIVILF